MKQKSESDRFRVCSNPILQPDDVKTTWMELQQRVGCSYFQSWGWIGTWLEQVVSDLNPVLVQISDAERIVGLGIFVGKAVRRRVFINSNALFLNEYPFPGRNMVVEYNGLLVDPRYDKAVIHRVLIEHLLCKNSAYDEVNFGAVNDCMVLKEAVAKADVSCQLQLTDDSLSWHVDLAASGDSIDAYLNSLSKNRRAQIRRTVRLYEERGPLSLSEAGDVDQALKYFEGLGELHKERWKRKGLPGSFSNPIWVKFHRSLIIERFQEGEVQLIKISIAGENIAYLYNFIWNGRVYVLQTGFSIPEDKRYMPGYLAHTLAIVHNKRKGMEVYDFMHGDSLYKQLLCNRSEKLFWVSVQKRSLKFFLESMAVSTVRWARAHLGSR